MQKSARNLDLNEQQQAAVNCDDSVLVLSGAGTGKTRVITAKINYLLENGVEPKTILALTFTNKAAREMKERLSFTQGLFVGTFHSFGLNIIKEFTKEAGLESNFQIIDYGDQVNMIRRIIDSGNVNFAEYDINATKQQNMAVLRNIINHVNLIKESQIEVAGLTRQLTVVDKEDYANKEKLFLLYQDTLSKENKVDFTDLLVKPCMLLKDNSEIRNILANRYEYILIDELQDIDPLQIVLIESLRNKSTKYFGVGDDDQSIYRFRGASPRYMRYFTKKLAKDNIIKLEKNYRSTDPILKLANSVISRNKSRLGKNLTGISSDATDKPKLNVYDDEDDEAQDVANTINNLIRIQNVNANDIAIFYRNHTLSSLIEHELAQINVPFKVFGGPRFFERAEIKDALAYLQVAINQNDLAAILRSINNPPRKVGAKKQAEIQRAVDAGYNLWDYICQLNEAGIQDYVSIIHAIKQETDIVKAVTTMLDRCGLKENLIRKGEEDRASNLDEIVNAATRFKINYENDLTEFLSSLKLDSAAEVDEQAVSLMTIHASKGLEFDHVFVIGVNHGILPRYDSRDEDFEEDRRLLYVAITRAGKSLNLSYSKTRMFFGSPKDLDISPYLKGLERKMECNFTKFDEDFDDEFDLKDKTNANGSELAVGDKVHSNAFGSGVILGLHGYGEKAKAHVLFFAKRERKWLVLNFANLRKI